MCSQLEINPPKPEEIQPSLSLPVKGTKTQGRGSMCLAYEQEGVREGIKALVGTLGTGQHSTGSSGLAIAPSTACWFLLQRHGPEVLCKSQEIWTCSWQSYYATHFPKVKCYG